MTKLQWLILWSIFLGYLFLGAFIFYQIERKLEEDLYAQELKDIEDPANKIQDIFFHHFKTDLKLASQVKVIEKINSYCNKTIFVMNDYIGQEYDTTYRWTYYNSFFFALTTLSTIGYGNLHPSTSLGRIVVIIYALFGIPLNGIVLTKLGELFSSTFITVHRRYKTERYESRAEMTIDIILYLIPGIFLFIFVPAIILVYFEGWTFDESVYFAFVTLTTIGYGDLVAGQTNNTKEFYDIYKVFLIFWIMIGLGYLVMILGFISRGMRCQQMSKIEQKLSQNLKLTQSKVWNEFMKDITYVRRMMNEMYLIKFRPIYKENGNIPRRRSNSCPNLTEWPVLRKVIEVGISAAPSLDEEEMAKEFQTHRMKRRAGVAENIIKPKILKTNSEGDLSKIDRVATFGTSPVIEPSELLARVVDALGTTCGLSASPSSSKSSLSSIGDDDYLRKKYENGIHGFGDEEILASEHYQDAQKTMHNLPMNEMKKPTNEYSSQWTWAGLPNPNYTKNNVYQRKRTNSILPDEKSHLAVPHVRGLRRMSIAAINFLSNSASKTHTWFCNSSRRASAVDPEAVKVTQDQPRVRKHSENDLNRLSVPSENYGIYGSMNTQENRLARRASILGVLANQIGPPRNFLSSQNMSNPVLEQTTLSDFLKILDSVHHKVPLHLGDAVQTVNEVKPDRQPAALISLFQNQASNRDQYHTPQKQNKPNQSTKHGYKTFPVSDAHSPPITSCLINSVPTSTRKRRLSLSPMSVNWYPTVVTPRNRRASFAFVHSPSPSSFGSTLPTLYQADRKRSKSSSNIDLASSSSSVASNPKKNVNMAPPKIYVVTPGQTSRRIRRFSVRQCEEETYRQKKSD
uniref:Open rectifier potassium channel protein 1 n=3 Tax=Cacopsylla melanoneura TaxID=428564 RepID=A0A8D8U251_9HEMI